ncbi:glycosyltransferase family 2 protein [uncultured Dialister sp.]|uniref:glycosyltransferase family 2 protein n=1 Tax=uncultured Dialister sp. TaxID=278064 RepID=UPI002670B3FF|nr:glycosyltransferase family 2 protein [uncultured Dialister sp.]
MKTGIVILNYNDYMRTIACADHILLFPSIDYIVIVDNGSTNNSFENIKDYYKFLHSSKLKIIESGSNGGYAKGNNIGINHLLNNTDSDIIGIVNPDITFENNLGEEIKNQFLKYRDFAVLTGVQTDKSGHISKRAFWRDLSIPQFIISMSPTLSKLQSLILGNYVFKKLNTSEEIVDVPTVEGCLFFIRANVARDIKGFDEGTFLFMEEDILSWKVRNLGWKIGVIKNIKFIHDHSATIGQFISYLNRVKIMNKSRRYYFCKYLFKGKKSGKSIYSILELISWIEQMLVMIPYLFIKNRIIH